MSIEETMETALSDHFVTINDEIEYERRRFILIILNVLDIPPVYSILYTFMYMTNVERVAP